MRELLERQTVAVAGSRKIAHRDGTALAARLRRNHGWPKKQWRWCAAVRAGVDRVGAGCASGCRRRSLILDSGG
ncbi:MAG: hypothetical protein ACLUHE_17120 [Christensenellales bacterium]